MTEPPDLRDLVGDDVPPEELERLERAHRLLVAAGPPPELPPSLAEPPIPPVDVPRRSWLPQRHRGAALAAAAAVLAASFGAGYLLGGRDDFEEAYAVTMRRTAAAPPGASASLRVGERDAAGNRPIVMQVRGLRELPRGGWYELYLTRAGKRAASCGTFRVTAETTEVRLNAPYRLRSFDGWVVSAHLPGRPRAQEDVLLRWTRT